MTRSETPAENLRGYLRQLTPQTRARLLAEVERLRHNGEDLPGADIIMAELRPDAKPDTKPDTKPPDRLDHAARHFFRAIEPYLTDRPPERASAGRIARSSLQPIWDWISRDLMASMARAYASELKQRLTGNKQRELEQTVKSFQNKAVKYLDGTFASATGADQARARLASHGAGPAGFDDLLKMLRVLKARDALGELDENLPASIDKLAGDRLGRTLAALDKLAAAHPDAVPFGLVLVGKRLAAPWQVVRLATKATETKDAEAIAATPYAYAVMIVLDHLDDELDVLRTTLQNKHIRRAKELVAAIHDTDYALRVRIELAGSAWGHRLDTIMQAVLDVVASEEHNMPAGLHHVLRSRGLQQHRSLRGRLTWLAWKCRDVVADLPTHLRSLLAAVRNWQPWNLLHWRRSAG
jgi:hypothetical protein